jgi:hypothetical protein
MNISATEHTWRLPSSPIVEQKNIRMSYVNWLSGRDDDVDDDDVDVDDDDDDVDDDDADDDEDDDDEEKDMLREKSNNPNLKGGKKYGRLASIASCPCIKARHTAIHSYVR